MDAYDRDPVFDTFNRASVANGRMGKWQRFNRSETLVWIDDAEGIPRALTPRQYAVMVLAMEMIDRDMLTMRQMASRLNFAPSTVSRALTKLAAWGLIAYAVGRGRWAGLVVMRRTKNDGWDAFRQAAKARIRRWSQAANRRLSRLAANVAPYLTEEGVRVFGDPSSSTNTKSATLILGQRWEIAEDAQ